MRDWHQATDDSVCCDWGRARVLPIGLATRGLPGEPTVIEQMKALQRSRLTPAQLADLAYFENRASIPSEAAAPAGTSMNDPRLLLNTVLWLGWMNTAGWTAYAIWLWVRRWRGAGSK